MGVAGERKCKMCVCNREGGVVGVAEERKCKMCVCNRESGVVVVATKSKKIADFFLKSSLVYLQGDD